MWIDGDFFPRTFNYFIYEFIIIFWCVALFIILFFYKFHILTHLFFFSDKLLQSFRNELKMKTIFEKR